MEKETERNTGLWKQLIRVDRNATAIMRLPCVVSCEKRRLPDAVIRGKATPTHEYLYRLVDGSYVAEGMWLCEDTDGRWKGFTNWEMKNVKMKKMREL